MAINSMDTRIERKSRFKKKHIYSLIGIAVGLLCLLWLLFRDTSSSLKVEKERITIATVQKGEFNDYIRVIGQVLPDRRRTPDRGRGAGAGGRCDTPSQ